MREEYRALCVEQGMTNLQMLSTHEPTEEYAKLSFSCRYPMGMDFLLRLQQIIGDEAMSAIFRELYRTIHLRFGTGYYLEDSDPQVYEVVLEHTPLDKVERVKDLFRERHGGPFVDEGS